MVIERRVCRRCQRPIHKGKCVGSSRNPALRADQKLEVVRRFPVLLENDDGQVARCLGDRACPHPPVLGGLCRGHALDRLAEHSLLGSTLGGAA